VYCIDAGAHFPPNTRPKIGNRIPAAGNTFKSRDRQGAAGQKVGYPSPHGLAACYVSVPAAVSEQAGATTLTLLDRPSSVPEEKQAIEGSGMEESAVDLEQAYGELIGWIQALLATSESCLLQIREARDPASGLPAGCPSHNSAAELIFRDVKKRFADVEAAMKQVESVIERGGW
jgi:hypothetical protein